MRTHVVRFVLARDVLRLYDENAEVSPAKGLFETQRHFQSVSISPGNGKKAPTLGAIWASKKSLRTSFGAGINLSSLQGMALGGFMGRSSLGRTAGYAAAR